MERFEIDGVYVLDTVASPLIVNTVSAPFDEVSLPHYQAGLEAVLSTGRKVLTIVDIHFLSLPSAGMRQAAAKMVNDLEPLIRKNSLGSVTILRSRLARGTVTAISWLRTSLVEERYVGTMQEATEVAREIFVRNGVSLYANPQIEEKFDALVRSARAAS